MYKNWNFFQSTVWHNEFLSLLSVSLSQRSFSLLSLSLTKLSLALLSLLSLSLKALSRTSVSTLSLSLSTLFLSLSDFFSLLCFLQTKYRLYLQWIWKHQISRWCSKFIRCIVYSNWFSFFQAAYFWRLCKVTIV